MATTTAAKGSRKGGNKNGATAAAAKPAAEKKPKAGPAPGGLTWVDWFKAEAGKGRDVKALEERYCELRKNEPAYKDDGAKLKRHAYRHRVLALGKPTAVK